MTLKKWKLRHQHEWWRETTVMHDLYCTVCVCLCCLSSCPLFPIVLTRTESVSFKLFIKWYSNQKPYTITVHTSSTLLPAKSKWCHWKSYLKTSSTGGFHHPVGQTCSRTSSVVDGGQKLPNRPTWRPGPTVSLLDWAKQQWNRLVATKMNKFRTWRKNWRMWICPGSNFHLFGFRLFVTKTATRHGRSARDSQSFC